MFVEWLLELVVLVLESLDIVHALNDKGTFKDSIFILQNVNKWEYTAGQCGYLLFVVVTCFLVEIKI